VIPSRSVPQGIAAMIRLPTPPIGNPEEIAVDMNEALTDVETGEITTATRSVEIDGVNVQEGQIICLLNGKLVLASQNLKDATLGLLEKAHANHFEKITLFNGVDVSRRDVEAITDAIRRSYPKQDIEVCDGGQPHYHFIISIE
jgi:dihydroxyacetone kinase-like predicted kinase